jgi:hypothetical protein
MQQRARALAKRGEARSQWRATRRHASLAELQEGMQRTMSTRYAWKTTELFVTSPLDTVFLIDLRVSFPVTRLDVLRYCLGES